MKFQSGSKCMHIEKGENVLKPFPKLHYIMTIKERGRIK